MLARTAAASVDFDRLDEDQVTALLLSGKHITALSAFFGDAEYRQLRRLAQKAQVRQSSATRIYILPGFLGSRLGLRTRRQTEVLWLDLNAVAAGQLLSLALPSSPPVQVLGAMLQGYLKIKLMLQGAGYDARLHPYDWRKSVADAGATLLRRMTRERAKNAVLIGHSMGGLVARAALARDAKRRIAKIIQLGTPNFGSYAPVQALRAVYPTVRKLAALDPQHSAEQLARHVFRTLPGIYQLLPSPEQTRDLDFFDLESWPADLLGPDATMLADARAVRERLGAARDGCHHIVGVDQETVTRATRVRSGFVYQVTRDGDGTVPRVLAEWPGAQAWYVNESHGNLPNSERVGTAIVDLIERGTTRKLARDWQPANHAIVRSMSDMQLRRELRGKLRADRLSIDERRRILEPAISAEFHGANR